MLRRVLCIVAAAGCECSTCRHITTTTMTVYHLPLSAFAVRASDADGFSVWSEETGARERVANLQLAVMHDLQLAISCIVMRF